MVPISYRQTQKLRRSVTDRTGRFGYIAIGDDENADRTHDATGVGADVALTRFQPSDQFPQCPGMALA
jgi:hypothetical protein